MESSDVSEVMLTTHINTSFIFRLRIFLKQLSKFYVFYCTCIYKFFSENNVGSVNVIRANISISKYLHYSVVYWNVVNNAPKKKS